MALNLVNILTYAFIIYIIFYSFNIVTKFYGVSNDTYIPYLLFYVFLALCIIIVSK
jgi:hypothetical protein